jgi:hypothetical protein
VRGHTTQESAVNTELEQVVVQEVSDEALELAAGGAQGSGEPPEPPRSFGAGWAAGLQTYASQPWQYLHCLRHSC